MTYKFNDARIKRLINRVNEGDDSSFTISYKVPMSLKDDLDILIEQDMGSDETAILDDCIEKHENDFCEGYVVISFDEDKSWEEKYDYLYGRASQFDMLNNGEPLSVSPTLDN